MGKIQMELSMNKTSHAPLTIRPAAKLWRRRHYGQQFFPKIHSAASGDDRNRH